MTKKPYMYLSALAAAMLLGLTGCASAPEAAPETTPEVSEDAAAPSDSGDASFDAATAMAKITDCAQVEAAMAPYIEGLVASPGNTVDEWGVTCQWETSEAETDLSKVRVVSVGMAPPAAGPEKPALDMVLEVLDGAIIEDDWVESNDGVAYTAGIGTGVIGAVVTTVWLPGVETTITGGAWADQQALDGPAAVAVVKQLLS